MSGLKGCKIYQGMIVLARGLNITGSARDQDYHFKSKVMRNVMIEDSVYRLSDKKYDELYKMGKEYLESLGKEMKVIMSVLFAIGVIFIAVFIPGIILPYCPKWVGYTYLSLCTIISIVIIAKRFYNKFLN